MTHNFHPSYRPDIDGLRAVAIFSVVIFHAFPKAISGGFVGVDIFFVISGFLISSIIFRGLETGRFSYIDFYARRIKRIFPALILVCVFCLVIGWCILLPDELINLGKHVIAGAAFVSNIISWKETGYFRAASDVKPLLHLWSLGVEEQYYIIWPALVALIWKRSHNFSLIVLPILIGSFLLNIFAINIRSAATFYLPVTRFWELMMGGVLAFIALHNIRIFHQRISNNVVASIGLCFLMAGLFLIDSDKKFPGWWAILPTMGTSFLIYAGKDAWVNSKILSNKSVVFIGLISYPLYLWHWPLFVYSRVIDMTGIGERVAILAISFVLAVFTYVFIEKPIRFGLSNRITGWLVSGMLLVTAFGVISFTGFLQPYHNSEEMQKISRATGKWEYPGTMRPFRFHERMLYHINREAINSQNPGTVLFFGDSNMAQYYPNIDALSHRSRQNIVFATENGCPPIPNVSQARHPQCIGFVDDVIAYASLPEVKTVVISAQWYAYFGKGSKSYFDNSQTTRVLFLDGLEGSRLAFTSFETMLSKLASMGKTTYLVLNIPIGTELSPKSMVNRSIHSEAAFFSVNYEGINEKDLDKYRHIDDALAKLARKTNAILIDPKRFMCMAGRCPSVSGAGEPIYQDFYHLRSTFVRTQIHFLDQTVK